MGLLMVAGTIGLPRESKAQESFNLSVRQDYVDPQNILLQDVADFSIVPTIAFPGIGQLAINQLPNIDFFQIKDLPNIDFLQIGQVPGLAQEISNLIQSGQINLGDLVGAFGIPGISGIAEDLSGLLFSQLPGLTQEFIGQFQSLLNFGLGGLPGFGLLQGLGLGSIPGLGLLPFNLFFGGSGIVSSMVELVTFKQYAEAQDGVLFVIDRGRPWTVGETRYVNANLRVTLERIIDHGPGTGFFYAEVLVPFVGWVRIPWPNAYEQSYGLYVPPTGSAPPAPVNGNPFNPKASLPANPSELSTEIADSGGGCGSSYKGVNAQAYARAISGIEGGYGSVGKFIRDSAGNRGRGLGRYQFVTYRNDIRAIIRQKPGGADFLAKADSGASISSGETLRVFTAEDQDALFRSDSRGLIDLASRTTDPTTGKPFTGTRLLERAAQMHFGGTGAPIDGKSSDALGRLSIYGYGKAALRNYQKALGRQNCGGSG